MNRQIQTEDISSDIHILSVLYARARNCERVAHHLFGSRNREDRTAGNQSDVARLPLRKLEERRLTLLNRYVSQLRSVVQLAEDIQKIKGIQAKLA